MDHHYGVAYAPQVVDHGQIPKGFGAAGVPEEHLAAELG
jgi:hypothetical protein